MKNKLTREEAISILNHVVEYYNMNYDTGEEESTTEETNNAWDALEVLINENRRSMETGWRAVEAWQDARLVNWYTCQGV